MILSDFFIQEVTRIYKTDGRIKATEYIYNVVEDNLMAKNFEFVKRILIGVVHEIPLKKWPISFYLSLFIIIRPWKTLFTNQINVIKSILQSTYLVEGRDLLKENVLDLNFP